MTQRTVMHILQNKTIIANLRQLPGFRHQIGSNLRKTPALIQITSRHGLRLQHRQDARSFRHHSVSSLLLKYSGFQAHKALNKAAGGSTPSSVI